MLKIRRVTRQAVVKRLQFSVLFTARKSGIRALSLGEGDELISVLQTDGEQNILLATRGGQAICFRESEVRVMGRDAAGVKGITLKGDDYVIGAAVACEGCDLLTVTEKGFGKRTSVAEYMRGDGGEPQHRGGKGMKNGRLTDKTGLVADVKLVQGGEDVLLISDDGTMIRMSVDAVNTYGRAAQGVRVMRLAEGVRISLFTVPGRLSVIIFSIWRSWV